MALHSFSSPLKFKTREIFGTGIYNSVHVLPLKYTNLVMKPLMIEAKANTRTKSAKIRNRRLRKKLKDFYPHSSVYPFLDNLESYVSAYDLGQFNGTPRRPRLSVFCSDKQLYAMLVDDQNKKCLFYGSTLQKSIRGEPTCTTVEAAERVGEELIKTCIDLNINEISCYDRNGFARGERMQAFEIAISRHGFLPC